MKIDWDKIVTQAITTVVVGVFAGACMIVWKGATTVGDRVAESEAKIVHVIEGVSEELATTRAEMQKDIAQLRIDMSNRVAETIFYGPPSPQQHEYEQNQIQQLENTYSAEQKVIKADLLEKLQYKK